MSSQPKSNVRYYATYFVLVWTYDGLYDDNPLTAFTIWSVLLSWIYAHPMWFFRMVVVILQKWFLIGAQSSEAVRTLGGALAFTVLYRQQHRKHLER